MSVQESMTDTPSREPVVGEKAPDFQLYDQARRQVKLSDFRGRKNVVLVFYPFAFSSVCGSELCAIRDSVGELQNDDVQVLTVSVDSVHAHRVWAQQQGFDYPLLADFWPHGEVARAYGVFNEEMGAALRGTFIIDRNGVLRWKVVNAVPDARELDAYRAVLAGL
jgi:mycoredoxin-dependent peroxiredoxin